MYNIGDKFVVIVFGDYILSVVYMGINKGNNLKSYWKYGSKLFKIVDVYYNKHPEVFNFTIDKVSDSNLYYQNKDFLFNEKKQKKEIISAIFTYF